MAKDHQPGAPPNLTDRRQILDSILTEAERFLVGQGSPTVRIQKAGTTGQGGGASTERIASATAGLVVLAAHAAAETDGGNQVLLEGSHPALGTVGDALGALLSHLDDGPLVPDSWVDDRCALCDFGVDGWMEA